jgi:pimeloyl-ACP methyl ester carboxylesterase
MSGPPVRYADSGGVEIAYQVLGDGPLDVVWVSGAFTHLGVFWEHPGYRRFCEQLASFSRLILFDKRGMGLSERKRVGTLEERMDDVRAVMDAAVSERAALIGVWRRCSSPATPIRSGSGAGSGSCRAPR